MAHSLGTTALNQPSFSRVVNILTHRLEYFRHERYDTIGVTVEGNFSGVQRKFYPNFPKFARKTFMRQAFLLQLFCCSCWYIIFSSSMRPQTRNLNIWIFQNLEYPIEQCRLGCARTLSEASWLSTLSIGLTVMRVGGVLFAIQLLLSARNLTPSCGRYMSKAPCFRREIDFLSKIC